AALEQARGLLGELVPQLRVADLAQRREAGARAHRARHETGTVGRGGLVRGLTCDPGRLLVQLPGPVTQAVLAEGRPQRTERVGLDRVRPGLEVLPVHPGDQVGPGVDQHLVAPFELRAAEVVGGEVLALEPRPRGAVEDEDPVADLVEVRGAAHDQARLQVAPDAVGTDNLAEVGRGEERQVVKIYTRKGDDGTTGLLFGGRVRKDDPAPTAYGEVDEAQASIGVARAHVERGSELDRLLVSIERDLWVLMA